MPLAISPMGAPIRGHCMAPLLSRLADFQSHLDKATFERVCQRFHQLQTPAVAECCHIGHTQEPPDAEIDNRRRHRSWVATLEYAEADSLIRKAVRCEALDREQPLPRVQFVVDARAKLAHKDLVDPARHALRVIEEMHHSRSEQVIAQRNPLTLRGRRNKFTHVTRDPPYSSEALRSATGKTLLRHGFVVQGTFTRQKKATQSRRETALVEDHTRQVAGSNHLCSTIE